MACVSAVDVDVEFVHSSSLLDKKRNDAGIDSEPLHISFKLFIKGKLKYIQASIYHDGQK